MLSRLVHALSTLRLLALLVPLALVGCEDKNAPYLEITGGGFIFNYRIGEATLGVFARPQKGLPDGAVAEARFENPAGGEPLVVSHPVKSTDKRVSLTSPPLQGVRKDVPYEVELRLVAADGTLIESHAKTFTSQIDQASLPGRALTVGPGYHRNPASLKDLPPHDGAPIADPAAVPAKVDDPQR